MNLPRKRTTVAGAYWAVLVTVCCLAGCSQAPSEADESAPDLSVHRKSHVPKTEKGDTSPRHHHEPGHEPERAGEATAEVSEKAKTVLKYIDEHHEAPKGYEGGRVFHNFGGAGEQGLPKQDGRGQAVSYHEWDVNPKVEGVNRGTERLITGSDRSAYYTADHYRTFTKIR